MFVSPHIHGHTFSDVSLGLNLMTPTSLATARHRIPLDPRAMPKPQPFNSRLTTPLES